MRILKIFLVVIIIVSCSDDDIAVIDQSRPFTAQNINFTELAKNEWPINEAVRNYSNGIELVISSLAEWQNFEANFSPGSSFFDPSVTPIDFNNEDIIVVMGKYYTSAPSDATILSITEELNEVGVFVEYSGPGGAATLSHAYHIVKIPKQIKPFVFQ